MSAGVKIFTYTEDIGNPSRRGKKFKSTTGVRPNFTIFSGDKVMEKGEFFGSRKSVTFASSTQLNIYGYLSGLCDGMTKKMFKKI
jgi:hypothetical protein